MHGLERAPIEGSQNQLAGEQPVNISRVVTVAPTPLDSLAQQLAAGKPLTEIAFTQALLIQKSGKSEASAHLVMPIGGEADPKESTIAAGLRELGEEATLITFSEKAVRTKSEEVRTRPTFKFTIPGKKYEGKPRIISMFPVEVQSASVSAHTPREGSHGGADKIADVVPFSPRELKQLVAEGEVICDGERYFAADHFTTNENPRPENPISQRPIIIDDDAREARRQMLSGILNDVDAFEGRMRNATLREINLTRVRSRREKIADLSQAGNTEIITGFQSAQARMALVEERARERDGEQKPPPYADLLKIAPYSAALHPEQLDAFFDTAPTTETGKTLRHFERGLKAGIYTISEGIEDPEILDKVTQPGVTALEALKVVWPAYLKLPLEKRVDLINAAEDAAITELGRDPQTNTVDPEKERDIHRGIVAAHQFHRFITNDLRSNRGGEFDFFQEHDPLNEIANAGLFSHMIFALGLHPNRSVDVEAQESFKRLRFEAFRGLAVLKVGADRAEMFRKADNKLFEGSLDSFFQFPPQSEEIIFGDGASHSVYRRITEQTFDVGDGSDGKQLHVHVDERPVKDLLSATRKGFQDTQMNDIFSVNFALANSNFDDGGDTRQNILNRITTAQSFGDSLIGHVQAELGGPESGWTVSRIDHRTKIIDKIKRFAEGSAELDTDNHGGKRAGSQGDRIIREKFTLMIENEEKGIKQFVEVCIYPFESASSDGVSELSEAGYWGFAEKITDDREGNYNASRTLARSSDEPTVPSLYERLYPGHLYENLSVRMARRHVRPRKDA